MKRALQVNESVYLADDVRDGVALDEFLAAARVVAQRHGDVREILAVGIVFGILRQLFGDLEQRHVDGVLLKVVADLLEVLLDARQPVVGRQVAQDLFQRVLATAPTSSSVDHQTPEVGGGHSPADGQLRPIAADDVQALDLLLRRHGAVAAARHRHRRVLLLLEQQQPLEHAVHVQFQVLVQLVDLLLDLWRNGGVSLAFPIRSQKGSRRRLPWCRVS